MTAQATRERPLDRERAIEERIGYRFSDKILLRRALTHGSVGSEGRRADNYQRLEFLGDRVLGLVVADMLLRAFPHASEGELSRRLAALVREETCAGVALAMGLDGAVRVGPGRNARERVTPAVLADVCEAVVGAVFLDAGFAPAAALVARFWTERMMAPAPLLRDPKTMLQEWAQARGMRTPAYREVERSGPHHDPQFRIAVELAEEPPAEGVGRSKRAAEQAAASAMLARHGIAIGEGDG